MTSSVVHVTRVMTLLVATNYLIINQVSCMGTFQVLVYKFSPSSLCSPSSSSSSSTDQRSALYFRVCLSHFQYRVLTDKCTYGEGTSTAFQTDTGSLSFSPIKINITFSWPGSYSLVIDAKCTSYDSANSTDQTLLRMVNSANLSPADQWTNLSYRSEAGSQLDYGLRVVCDEYLHGPNCAAFCKPRNDALGHFTCSPNGSRVCSEGWTDTDSYCTTAICENNCNHGNGSCVAPNKCNCFPGWSGTSCDICLPALNCNAQHGTCQMPGECNCMTGWGGLYCNEDLQICTNQKPCANGGTCRNSGPDGFECECPPDFKGPTCLSPLQDCSQHPCLNGATCLLNEFGYQCTCQPGYTGDRCQSDLDACQSNPCLNDGSCVDETNGFRCLCSPGFSGHWCEENVGQCLSDPCKKQAACYDDANEYRCVCRPGAEGHQCIYDVTNPVQSANATRNSSGLLITPAAASSSVKQLALIVCLGVVIPTVVIVATVVIWLVVRKLRRRRRRQQNSSSGSAGASGADGDNIRNDIRTLNNYIQPVTYKVPCDSPVRIKATNLADDNRDSSAKKDVHDPKNNSPTSVDRQKYSDANFKQLNWTGKFEKSDKNILSCTDREAIYCIDRSLDRHVGSPESSACEDKNTSPHRFDQHPGKVYTEPYVDDHSVAPPSPWSVYATPCSTPGREFPTDGHHALLDHTNDDSLRVTLV